MTPYHFANQEKKIKVSRTRIAGVVFLVIGLIGTILIFLVPFIQRIARGPAWLASSFKDSVSSEISMLTPKSTLLAQNQALQEQVKQYEAQTLQLVQLQDENAQLTKELSYLPNPVTTVTAQVIGKPSDSIFNTLIIDQGTNQGLKIGQLVTVQHNLGIGTINSVSTKTATVGLFGAPDFTGDVLLSSKNITIPATGKGSGNFEIHIPREVGVSDGDLLAFPQNPDVVIGVVKSIIFDPRDPFQTVLARAPVNVQQLRFVEVVK
jgi:cell shape-determining protein MreC